MNLITTVLFWISTGLLIPVIVGLIVLFVWALLMVGKIYGKYTERLRLRPAIQQLIEKARQGEGDLCARFQDGSALSQCIQSMERVGWRPVHAEQILDAFEQDCEGRLSEALAVSRLGPMLGLMGTLIPMGPALVELAAGNLGGMASNMQLAFSTTVVGLFVGAAGFVVHLRLKHWYTDEMNHLSYLLEIKKEER